MYEMKMMLKILVLCLQMLWVYSAPIQLQFFNPYQRIFMPPQQNLQQQLMELQAMQQLNPMMSMGLNNQPQPLLVLMPDMPSNIDAAVKDKDNNQIENRLKLNDREKIQEDPDSVVIDAEPMPILEDQKAFLVLPDGRFSIGGFISSIPFLPIEINVPDTISWAYDGIASGISSIISIIGQRLPGPFKRPPTEGSMPVNLKSLINNIRMKNQNQNSMMRPIIVMPLGIGRPMLPML